MKLKLHDYQEVTKDFIIKTPYAAVILDMGMGKTATISVRVDELDKQSAEQVLKQLGMPISTLVTLLLKQVSLTKKIPFDIALPDVPSSVNVEEMTAERFGQMMVEVYHEAENGHVRSVNEFFKEFKERNV